jgi:hypothetical protein
LSNIFGYRWTCFVFLFLFSCSAFLISANFDSNYFWYWRISLCFQEVITTNTLWIFFQGLCFYFLVPVFWPRFYLWFINSFLISEGSFTLFYFVISRCVLPLIVDCRVYIMVWLEVFVLIFRLLCLMQVIMSANFYEFAEE